MGRTRRISGGSRAVAVEQLWTSTRSRVIASTRQNRYTSAAFSGVDTWEHGYNKKSLSEMSKRETV